MDAETQRRNFVRAVGLLGGPQATGQAIGLEQQRIAALLGGTEPLHAGILEAVARALIAHADACRVLERAISPAFADNLTDAQRNAPFPRPEDRA